MTNIDVEDRYRALFANNVAGAALSTPAGRIVDCNEAFSESFGFASPAEVLARSAWDYYLDRRDRDRVIQPENVTENYIAQELPFRHRTERPVWFRFTRVIVCRAKGRPELLLVTAMDVTELRRLKAQVRQLSTVNVTFPVQGGDTSVHELVEELAGHLQTVNLTLRPENLEILSKSHVQQFTKSVERMKVLLGELVVKNLNIDEEQ